MPELFSRYQPCYYATLSRKIQQSFRQKVTQFYSLGLAFPITFGLLLPNNMQLQTLLWWLQNVIRNRNIKCDKKAFVIVIQSRNFYVSLVPCHSHTGWSFSAVHPSFFLNLCNRYACRFSFMMPVFHHQSRHIGLHSRHLVKTCQRNTSCSSFVCIKYIE